MKAIVGKLGGARTLKGGVLTMVINVHEASVSDKYLLVDLEADGDVCVVSKKALDELLSCDSATETTEKEKGKLRELTALLKGNLRAVLHLLDGMSVEEKPHAADNRQHEEHVSDRHREERKEEENITIELWPQSLGVPEKGVDGAEAENEIVDTLDDEDMSLIHDHLLPALPIMEFSEIEELEQEIADCGTFQCELSRERE